MATNKEFKEEVKNAVDDVTQAFLRHRLVSQVNLKADSGQNFDHEIKIRGTFSVKDGATAQAVLIAHRHLDSPSRFQVWPRDDGYYTVTEVVNFLVSAQAQADKAFEAEYKKQVTAFNKLEGLKRKAQLAAHQKRKQKLFAAQHAKAKKEAKIAQKKEAERAKAVRTLRNKSATPWLWPSETAIRKQVKIQREAAAKRLEGIWPRPPRDTTPKIATVAASLPKAKQVKTVVVQLNRKVQKPAKPVASSKRATKKDTAWPFPTGHDTANK